MPLHHEVPLTAFVVRYLNEHLQRPKDFGFNYLLPRLGGTRRCESQPIGAAALREILLSKFKAAGITLAPERRYSPHCMRATLATHLLIEVEAPIHDVQGLLGHGNPATTLAYVKRKKRHDKSPVFKIES